MFNHGMLVCSFYFKKRFSQSNLIYKLNHKIPEETPLYDDVTGIFRSFCEEHMQVKDDEKKQKLFSIKADSFKVYAYDTFRAISFVIISGDYGIEADITNRHTRTVVHHRNSDEANMQEFHCVAYIPYDAGKTLVKKGILVFESIASYGVKTVTTRHFRAFLANSDITLETRSVSVRSFMEKLISQDKLYRITFIRNHISPNQADNMLISTGREERSYIRPKFQPAWLQKFLSMFEEGNVCEIPDGEDFDDVSVQFKLGDKQRTVRLKNLDRFSIVEDMPDEVVSETDDKKLIDYMINTADAYAEKMVFEITGEA